MLLFLVTWRTSLQISSKIPRICNLNLLKRAAEIFRDPGRDIIADLKCTIFRRIFRRGPRFLQFQQLRTIPRKHGIVKLKSFETTDTLITDWRNVTKRHLLAWINKFHRNVIVYGLNCANRFTKNSLGYILPSVRVKYSPMVRLEDDFDRIFTKFFSQFEEIEMNIRGNLGARRNLG